MQVNGHEIRGVAGRIDSFAYLIVAGVALSALLSVAFARMLGAF